MVNETRVEWGGAAGPSLRGLIGAARVHLDLEGVRAAFGEIEATGATCIAGARWAWPAPTRRAEPRPLAELLAAAGANIPPGRVALALRRPTPLPQLLDWAPEQLRRPGE